MSKIKFVFWLGVLLTLNACSSTNVSGEWDCPRQLGHGCITIDEADQIAVQRLQYKEHSSTEIVQKIQNKIIEKRERKVWFAPHTDKSGNKHEASTAYYYEEIPSTQDSSLEPTVDLESMEQK